MIYDTSKTGWRTILRDYSADILEKFILRGVGYEMNSREAFEYELAVRQEQGLSISRASVINTLNDMVDMKLLTYRETSAKGGYHRVYRLAGEPKDLKTMVTKQLLASLDRLWT